MVSMTTRLYHLTLGGETINLDVYRQDVCDTCIRIIWLSTITVSMCVCEGIGVEYMIANVRSDQRRCQSRWQPLLRG